MRARRTGGVTGAARRRRIGRVACRPPADGSRGRRTARDRRGRPSRGPFVARRRARTSDGLAGRGAFRTGRHRRGRLDTSRHRRRLHRARRIRRLSQRPARPPAIAPCVVDRLRYRGRQGGHRTSDGHNAPPIRPVAAGTKSPRARPGGASHERRGGTPGGTGRALPGHSNCRPPSVRRSAQAPRCCDGALSRIASPSRTGRGGRRGRPGGPACRARRRPARRRGRGRAPRSPRSRSRRSRTA